MKKKKLLLFLLLIICLLVVSGVFIYVKYPGKVKRYITRWFMTEGKIQGLTEVNGDSDWVMVSLDHADIGVEKNQSLLLINSEYRLAEDFSAEVSEYKDSGVYMNCCVMEAYEKLAEEVYQRFDVKLYVRSAYRSQEEQEQQIEENGEKAAEVGTSEHQAGLALDVYVPYYAGDGFLDHEAGIFVNEFCGNYGFIIRYPAYGKESTGIDYEPWHIRYVGEPHAEIIMNSQSTFEGYMKYLKKDQVYSYKNYFILRTEDHEVLLPSDSESIVVSPDNTGGYIVTVKVKEE